MKTNALTGLLLMVLLCCCKKEEPLLYNIPDNVYFDLTPYDDTDRSDSIVYSFAYHPEKEMDTVLIGVLLSGERKPVERKFRIGIVDTATTAIAGQHYKALEDSYVLQADSGRCLVPLLLYNTDTALTGRSVTIKLQLLATDDFGVSFPVGSTGSVKFSNQLEKPVWWDVWASELGAYSRVKHELFIRTSGTTELAASQADYLETPKVLYYTRRFKSFLQDPFRWVEAYPEEGYVITLEEDGYYYFYSTGNPEKTYRLEKNVSNGKYYFNDENDKPII